MKLMLICFIFIATIANADEYDRYQQDMIDDYNNDSISRWNEQVRYEKPDWQVENEQRVKEINRYNLYKDGDDYKGEVITIERKGYRIND